MKKNYIILLALFCLGSIHAQKTLEISLDEVTRVTVENEGGLYFAGTKNTNFRFSQRITPHGDCIDIVNGLPF